MKMPTAWEYRHVFEVVALAGFIAMPYAIVHDIGWLLVVALVAFVINLGLMIHLSD
jgi:hypothetical protein